MNGKLLRNATKFIRGHHAKGTYYRDGSYCAMGAVGKALGVRGEDMLDFGLSPEADEIGELLTETAKEQFPDRFNQLDSAFITFFNDHPDTTEDDIIMVMEKAAIKLDEQA